VRAWRLFFDGEKYSLPFDVGGMPWWICSSTGSWKEQKLERVCNLFYNNSIVCRYFKTFGLLDSGAGYLIRP
jgi:hypothetical protein